MLEDRTDEKNYNLNLDLDYVSQVSDHHVHVLFMGIWMEDAVMIDNRLLVVVGSTAKQVDSV